MDTIAPATPAERRLQIIAWAVLVPILALAAYSWLACLHKVPAAPWSPLGTYQQQQDEQHKHDRPAGTYQRGPILGLPDSLNPRPYVEQVTPAEDPGMPV